MAFERKTTAPKTLVEVDFPPLPKVFNQPVFGQHQAELDEWYEALKDSVIGKLESLAEELDKKQNVTTSSTTAP